MRRRDVLAAVGLAAGAASLNYPAPAIARGFWEFTLVTDWPEGPGMLPSARRLAQRILEASGGRLRIEVFPSGSMVRPFETFDAVSAGVADMFHTHIGYFEKKSPAFHFFSSVPFGFTADYLFAWVHFGGGQELWDALCGQFNIKPLLASSTGSQMGGWFTHEITSTESFSRLRYRMVEPGADIFRQLGAIVVVLPGSEIVHSLQSGAIDACEWIGPWLDMAIGLDKAARYYYYPSWHEPGTALALGINRRVWDGLGESDRKLIETVAAGEYALSLAEFNINNAKALRALRQSGTVELRRFSAEMLQTFAEIATGVVERLGSGDELSRKIYQRYVGLRATIQEWSAVAEGAYLDSRAG